MSRLLLTLLMLVAASVPGRAEELPYGNSQTFAAFRNGERIGTHRLDFSRQGDELVVQTTIDLAVKLVGFTAYRYSHRGREVWRGDTLLTFNTLTDDDGKRYVVRAVRDHSGSVVVDRQTPDDPAGVRNLLPPGVLPSTHWNFHQTAQARLLNAQKGTVDPIRVIKVGRETVATGAGPVAATHYRYDGEVRMDQWFDDRGRWVKMTFVAPDGSVIEYRLES
ncbi:DUF6134 family protein [Reyranella sp.]|uniref:DUF6134 family protein n=1 Tax=Reyranella sp. TaxID=1929291 RepID=UPI003BA87F35